MKKIFIVCIAFVLMISFSVIGVLANHKCGGYDGGDGVCDQYTEQGVCTHGCYAGGDPNPSYHRDTENYADNGPNNDERAAILKNAEEEAKSRGVAAEVAKAKALEEMQKLESRVYDAKTAIEKAQSDQDAGKITSEEEQRRINNAKGIGKCDGWADNGSEHRNSGNGCFYTCSGGSWTGPNKCDGLGNGVFQGNPKENSASTAPMTIDEALAQLRAVEQRQTEALNCVDGKLDKCTKMDPEQTASQRAGELVLQRSMAAAQLARMQEILTNFQRTNPGSTADIAMFAKKISDFQTNVINPLNNLTNSSTSTVANQNILDDAKRIFKTGCSGNGYECSDLDGSYYCSGDAEKSLKLTVGSTECNTLSKTLSGKEFYGGIRVANNGKLGTASGGQWDPDKKVYIYSIYSLAFGTYTITFDPKTGKITGIPPKAIVRLFDCPLDLKYWNKDSIYGCGEADAVNDPKVTTFNYTDKNLSEFTFNNSCGIQQFDIDSGGSASQHISLNFWNGSGCGSTTSTPTCTPTCGAVNTYCGPKNSSDCGGKACPDGNNCPKNNPPGITSNPPSTPPPPIPSPPPGSTLACYQLQIFRGGVIIQPSQINQGDTVIFRGFATATNTTISKLRFTVSIGGANQPVVDVPATLVNGYYMADLTYLINQNTSYSVRTDPISP